MKCKQSDKFSDECTVLTTASMPKVLWLKSNSENKTASQKTQVNTTPYLESSKYLLF